MKVCWCASCAESVVMVTHTVICFSSSPRWVKSLSDYGFCVIKGVPTEEFMVMKVRKMLGDVNGVICLRR